MYVLVSASGRDVTTTEGDVMLGLGFGGAEERYYVSETIAWWFDMEVRFVIG